MAGAGAGFVGRGHPGRLRGGRGGELRRIFGDALDVIEHAHVNGVQERPGP